MIILRSALTVSAFVAAASAWAYQVTGPVLELTESKIVVQKGKEKWELARTPETKVSGDLKWARRSPSSTRWPPNRSK
jgi:hypothetical protein